MFTVHTPYVASQRVNVLLIFSGYFIDDREKIDSSSWARSQHVCNVNKKDAYFRISPKHGYKYPMNEYSTPS